MDVLQELRKAAGEREQAAELLKGQAEMIQGLLAQIKARDLEIVELKRRLGLQEGIDHGSANPRKVSP